MTILAENSDKIYSIICMIVCSLYFRFILQAFGQTWVKTIAHTATLSLLPILTYIITSVISGNIALSLGMVGALSIVRFRNPVRSPLELSVYFGAITMGITAAVSLKWLGMLVGSVSFVGFTLYLINVLSGHFTKNPFFVTSFSEGNQMATLVATSAQHVRMLDEHASLSSKVSDGQSTTYTLADPDFKKLKKIEDQLTENWNIERLQISK
jgi:hypothetical protein